MSSSLIGHTGGGLFGGGGALSSLVAVAALSLVMVESLLVVQELGVVVHFFLLVLLKTFFLPFDFLCTSFFLGSINLDACGTSNSFGISLGCGTSGGGGGGNTSDSSSSSTSFGGGAFCMAFGVPSLFVFGCGGDLKVGCLSGSL